MSHLTLYFSRLHRTLRSAGVARLFGGLFAVTAFACLSALTCAPATGPNPFPLPNGGILVIVENQSGVNIRVEAVFDNLGTEVRRTTLLLGAGGIHTTDQILQTVADRFEVTAAVAQDATGLPAGVQPGQVLLKRTFVQGTDYKDGDTIHVIIPPFSSPAGQGTDCDDNGILDAIEIASDPSLDCDHNGILDACETDSDGDGVTDACDACAGSDDRIDTDGDGKPDGCDPCPHDANDDSDGDGVCDGADLCPGHDDRLDADHDGTPDACDGCPNDPNKAAPGVCGCGEVENAGDDDGDGVPNCLDICSDGDDNLDGDGDGVPDDCDVCPKDNPDDSDGDGVCDSLDACPGHDDSLDRDHDGTPDDCDGCPDDANKFDPGVCGCGVLEDAGDDDEDGVPNCLDVCPGGNDPIDTDSDGVPDDCDACPLDNPDDSDKDGVCDSADICPGYDDYIDSDKDGTPDGCDGCPDDYDKTDPGVCGCGVIEDTGDDDEDGVPNCLDRCPGSDDSIDCNGNGIPDGCDDSARLYWTEILGIDRGGQKPGENDDRIRTAYADGACDVRIVRDSEDYPGEIDIGDGPSNGLRMYWSDSYRIRSALLDGTCPKTETYLSNDEFGGLAVNSSANELYWTEVAYSEAGNQVRVYRREPSTPWRGSTELTSVSGEGPAGVAYDESADILFWAQQSTSDCAGQIWTYRPHDVEPSPHLLICRPSRLIRGIALDADSQLIYWIEWIGEGETRIRRADYEGETISPNPLVSLEGPMAENIEIDFSGEVPKMYWTVPDSDRIMRSNLDGSDLNTDHLADLRTPIGIAISPGPR